MKIGGKIANARRCENLTQEQLAEMLGVSRQSISKWELDVAYPEMDNLVKLAEILHINCDYLLKDGVNDKGEKVIKVEAVKPVEVVRSVTVNSNTINYTFIVSMVGLFLSLVLMGIGIVCIVNTVVPQSNLALLITLGTIAILCSITLLVFSVKKLLKQIKEKKL